MLRRPSFVAVFLTLLVAVTAFADPPIFDTRPYSEAKKAAEKEDRYLIVKGTAVWCGPCKRMDASTWVDPKVVEWLKRNAVAVAVDVDKQQAIKMQLGIKAMPTMIAFKGGKEVDRIVGYRSPEQFIGWLRGLESGKGSASTPRERAAPAGGRGGKVDVQARLEEARSQVASRKDAEAIESYVWLWKNMTTHEPSMAGVRGSFMAGDMKRLAARSPAARTKFTALRDEAHAAVGETRINADALDDWLVLNDVIGDEAATLIWLDRVKGDAKWKPLLDRESFRLKELLVSKERWSDFGAMVGDPMRELRQVHQISHAGRPAAANDRDERRDRVLDEVAVAGWRRSAGTLYASLLAADRSEQAQAVAIEAMSLDAEPGMVGALVEWALKAEVPRAAQSAWLDGAIAKAKASADATGSDWTTSQLGTLTELKHRLDAAMAKSKETAAAPR